MKFILFLLSLFSCNSQPEQPAKPSALVTVPPYKFFVERIAGDSVDVQVLVPPGANPHIYEPTPKQVEKAYEVDIWFRLGEPSEEKILTVLQEQNQMLRVVDVTKGIDLMGEGHCCDHHEEGKDRHVWMSPKLAAIQAKTIAETLSEAFPMHKGQFYEGLNSLLADLESLDGELQKKLEPMKGDAILVSHPAFGYFCQEFGLKQLSIEYEGKEPLPQDVIHTLREAENAHVRAVFIQIQYNNKGALLVADKLHLPVYSVDPYASDYLENLRRIADDIH